MENKLTERQEKIVELLVREYVNNLRPVSSKLLAKKLNLSSATIRNEMKELEDKKYLIKPYTSAGRIPSDKAYRFFIQLSQKREDVALPIKISRGPAEEVSRDITQILAEMTGNLAFSAIKEMNAFYQSGISNLFKIPEFEDKEWFSEMGEIIENFEKRFNELFKKIKENETRVFIGSENPLARTRKISLIVSRCKMPNHKNAVIGVLGPIRMRYDYNISLINKLKQILEDFS